MQLDATVRPVLVSGKDAAILKSIARALARRNFMSDAAVVDALVDRYDAAEHLAVIDRRTLLAVDSRGGAPRRGWPRRSS
jgi:hypothetical protein